MLPDWPVPDPVQAVITLRSMGSSQHPYEHFNLATHVGDNLQQVEINRMLLRQQLGLQAEPLWLNQVHGTEVIYAGDSNALLTADGCYSDSVNQACVVLTADCLPVLLCNQQGTKVAAVHAGWRGLCGGIVRNALNRFDSDDTILAYLGPAISAKQFEVRSEVLDRFLSSATTDEHKRQIQMSFVKTGNDHYLADLYALAKAELQSCRVDKVYGGNLCSYSQPQQFYSYRRDKDCGRNASLIWLKSS